MTKTLTSTVKLRMNCLSTIRDKHNQVSTFASKLTIYFVNKNWQTFLRDRFLKQLIYTKVSETNFYFTNFKFNYLLALKIKNTLTSATIKLINFIIGVDTALYTQKNDITYDTHLSHVKCAFRRLTIFFARSICRYHENNTLKQTLSHKYWLKHFFLTFWYFN